jgi:glycosyltransferase involved in cell wall biosynthesis
MHVLFIHQNFPAQFGHIGAEMVRLGHRCSFASQLPPGVVGGVERIQYHLRGGATERTHYCSRTFENAIWHSHALYEALHARPDIRPDLVVAHSGFATSVFLRELYDCPIINYFEYFYSTKDSDMDFRPEFPCSEIDRLRARARNAALLLDLENCEAGYSPTRWQRDRLPAVFREKVRVVFDGVDTSVWHRREGTPRTVAGRALPRDMRIVTYATRGMESMRGFDVFMRMARILSDRRRDVVFAVVGQDRVCYGGDAKHTGGQSFKEWVFSRDRYDLDRFLFTGLVPPDELARIFSLSDVHVYLTVPFVLSWSLINALACGAIVVASDTAPVREVIANGVNGVLTDFFDAEAMADHVERVLDAPGDFAQLGRAGFELVDERYSLRVCLPQLLEFYDSVVPANRPQ